MPKNNKTAGIVRLIVLLIVMANQALVVMGWNPLPFSEEQIYEAVTAVATAVTAVYVWYRNNNITPEAEATQAQLERKKRIKNGGN